MLVSENVTVLFHGHDHVFVHQALDDVVYQECPMAGEEQCAGRFYEKGGYVSGYHERNAGFVQVDVCASHVRVAYVKTHLEGDPATTVYSYTLGDWTETP